MLNTDVQVRCIKCIFNLWYCQLMMALSRHNSIVSWRRSVHLLHEIKWKCWTNWWHNACLISDTNTGGLPRWLSGKESACNAGDTGDVGSIPGSGRSPGCGHGTLLQVFLPGESHGFWGTTGEPGRLQTHSIIQSWTWLKQLGMHAPTFENQRRPHQLNLLQMK